MNYTLATDTELMTIVNSDNNCPTHLLSGVAIEMIKRKLWNGVILCAGEKAYHNLNFILSHILKMRHDEFIHIGTIEIVRILETFNPGMRTFKTYVIMCLIAKFKKLKRAAEQEMRRANIGALDVNGLPTKIQDRIFQSPINVEQYVINKITLEENWNVLREIEKKAILLEQYGYKQCEISEMLGFKSKNHANTLLNRAYAKLRNSMGA
jgi:RNA polymerase sigma factor (sigma-70 family)